MRKFSLFWIFGLPLLLLLLGRVTTAAAQSQIAAGEQSWPQHLIPAPTDPPQLVSSPAITIYLPLILVPPPPNPKKGIGTAISPACADLQLLQASWYLNWSISPDPTCPYYEAKKFVPRINNADSMNFLGLAIDNAKESGWLIGFSEPNLPWQANMTPLQGALLWKQIEEMALPQGIKLVSPSPNQYNPGVADPHGHQWLWAMVNEYRSINGGNNPHFDAIAWNIYKRNPTDAKNFLIARYNEGVARGYNVPIWVLEYGGECWRGANSGNETIIKSMTPWLNSTPWIGRYAWFASRIINGPPYASGWTSCSLINPSTGSPTTLGSLYINY